MIILVSNFLSVVINPCQALLLPKVLDICVSTAHRTHSFFSFMLTTMLHSSCLDIIPTIFTCVQAAFFIPLNFK